MSLQKWIEVNNQVAGRDKVARFIQYGARSIWGTLDKAEKCPATADFYKTVEYIFSTFRKLLRLGKCIDVFYASLRFIHYPDLAVRLTLTMSKLSQALFLFADHVLWLARTGLFSNINQRWWNNCANKYWLLSIIMNLCRDFYEIRRLLSLQRTAVQSGITRKPNNISSNSTPDLSRLVLETYTIMLDHKDVAVDTLKNVCDFFIPLTALGYTNLTPRTVGLLGVISSAAAFWALVEPTAKLTPV